MTIALPSQIEGSVLMHLQITYLNDVVMPDNANASDEDSEQSDTVDNDG